jgi:hypothetical protein
MEGIAELAQQPAFAAAIINLLIGLIALRMRGGAARQVVVDADPDAIPLADVGAGHISAASWLGTCAAFHLLSAVLFALTLPHYLMAAAEPAPDPDLHATIETGLLFVVCLLLGISALQLAALTERLTAVLPQSSAAAPSPLAQHVPTATRRSSVPFVPVILVIGLIEVITFALHRPDLGYLVSEAGWMLACILIAGGLIRLWLSRALGGATRFWALVTAIGFFARALVSLASVLESLSALFLSGTPYAADPLTGPLALILGHAALAKAIVIAWTGLSLLLLAKAWRVKAA